jgi:oxygen-independent coproporphyrinogen-3 oxidase
MNLIKKYNVAGPRYTSYPTVPYWDKIVPELSDWKNTVKCTFDETNAIDGISVYIHLPFCESLCTYCGCNTRITKNHSIEQVYLQTVLKEWRLYLHLFKDKPRIKEIHLGGGTPTFFSADNLNVLIKGILSDAIVCNNTEFSFEAHPNNTTFLHLKTLFELGFKRLSLGIQDFDPKVQEIVNRVQSFESVEKVVNQARSLGYTSINFDLIYGLPLQTPKSVVDTINKVNFLMPDRIAFYSYAHVPWIKPGQRKFTELDLPVDEEKRALYEIGKEKFAENGYVEIGMDHFSLKSDTLYKALKKGKLHRNFMGYTHSYTKLMIGLGVSSISDAWNAYGQNEKNVEAYYEKINKGLLPIIKGHFLTSEDLIIRQHILNLMCKFKTDWNDPANQSNAVLRAIKLLSEMENDKLIDLAASSLRIKKTSHAFIRNVCMAFDARLLDNQPQSKLFSSVV